MKIKYLLPLLLLPFFTFSQNYVDIASISYMVSPSNTFKNANEQTNLHLMDANLNIPIVLNDKYTFLTGLTYDSSKAAFDVKRAPEKVTGISLKLGANVKYNNKWNATYLFLPRISSDFKKIGARDFQFGGALLLGYKKSERFKYKLGVFFNKEIYGPNIVPMIGLYYLNPNKKFEANLTLPFAFDLNYKIANKLRIGMNFSGLSNTYNINTPIKNESDRYLLKSTKELYTYLHYQFNYGLNVKLSAGRSISRYYRMYNEGISYALPLVAVGDNRTQLNTDFSDGWLFKIGWFYRFRFESK